MFKVVKLVVLLVIVICVGVGIYALVHRPGTSGGGPGELRSRESGERGVRVEEKYGFTTETLEP